VALEIIDGEGGLRSYLERKNFILATLDPSHDPEFTSAFVRYAEGLCNFSDVSIAVTSLAVRKQLGDAPKVAPLLELFLGGLLVEKAQGRFGLTEKLNEFQVRIGSPLCIKTEVIPELPHPTFGSAASALDGSITVTGGYDGKAVDFTQTFDQETSAWSVGPPMCAARFGHTLSACGGALFAVGGANDEHFLGDVEMLSVGSSRWERVGALASGRTKHTATRLDDRLLIAGGYRRPGPAEAHAFEVFDTSTRTTTPLTSRTGFMVGHTATPLGGNRVLITGGIKLESFETPGKEATASVILCEVDGEKTQTIGRLKSARSFHTATLGVSGKLLYVAGGFNRHQAVGTLEVFCMTSCRVVETIDLQFPRSNHSALVTRGGGVALIGGVNGHQVVSLIECFEPDEVQTRLLGFMQRPRYGFPTVTVGDGDYLIIGGAYEGRVSAAVERVSLRAMLETSDC